MKVTDALAELPFVDAERLGAMGWSFGGYMMMWMQGQTERSRCQAAMMGIFDLDSFYGATEELWFPERDLGIPWKDEENYARWSPSSYVENFRTPALVITGELDYRCPYTQSLGYFTALPPLFAKKSAFFRKLLDDMGTVRFYFMIFLFLLMIALPIKMFLRWTINLKYIVGIPEFFFNI
jgi:hypothetical protein